MPLENVVCIDPKNTNLQKNRGGGGIHPPRPLTSEKYLGPERVNPNRHGGRNPPPPCHTENLRGHVD